MSYEKNFTYEKAARLGPPPLREGRAPSDEAGLDLKGIFAILKRRRRIIFATVLACLLAMTGYLAVAKSTYSANVQILIDPREQKGIDAS